jgi:hypothetical protein
MGFMKSVSSRLAVACAAAFLATTASATAIPGLTFDTSSGSQTGCLNRHSFGGIRNDCTYAVEVSGSMIVPQGWRNTSINVFGNNSWCYAVSTGGNSNSASPPGPTVWTLAGPDTWNNLNTGSIYVYWNSTLVFTCGLEPGGVIGSAVSD